MLRTAARRHQPNLPHGGVRRGITHPGSRVLRRSRAMRRLGAHRVVGARFVAAGDNASVATGAGATAAAVAGAAARVARLLLGGEPCSFRPYLKCMPRFVWHVAFAVGGGGCVRLGRGKEVGFRYSLATKLTPTIVLDSRRVRVATTATRDGLRQRPMLAERHRHLHVARLVVSVGVLVLVGMVLKVLLVLELLLLGVLQVLLGVLLRV